MGPLCAIQCPFEKSSSDMNIPQLMDLPDPGIEPRFNLHCRQILYHLNHLGSPDSQHPP